ncbi:hypothetical protein F66182_6620 [Fusarium sp. NRRL 66182]|nr:hypothetical protein F66182_6620 [Fusarium sp. NRRL 66182]
MQAKFLTLLAATATTASALASTEHVKRVDVNVVHIYETLHAGKHIPNFSVDKRDTNAIFARQNNAECRSSATSILRSIPTPAADLESWARTARTTEPCSITAPSSVSDHLLSYLTAINQWALDREDELEEFIDGCGDGADTDDDVLNACSTPGTIFFTAANRTKTVELEPILATMTGTPSSNAAAPRGASLAAAVAAAIGVAGFMMAA